MKIKLRITPKCYPCIKSFIADKMSQMNKNMKAGFQITNSQTRDVEEKKIDLPAVDNTESR